MDSHWFEEDKRLLLYENRNIEVYKYKRQSQNDIEIEQESRLECYDRKVLQSLLEIPTTTVCRLAPLEGVTDHFKNHSGMPK